MSRLSTAALAAVALIVAAGLLAPPHVSAATHDVQPGSDWCDTINSAAPGDVVEFAAGDYPETCWIRATGEAGNRIVIRSADPDDPAHFTYDGNSSNVLDLVDGASYFTLKDLYFEPTQPAITAIKNKAAHHVRIEGCEFHGIGGISIAANGSSEVERSHIEIVDNRFIDLEATGIYIGCHDGEACQIDDTLIEGNLIKNVDSDNVGYGLEIKLNSVATIRDNAIYNAKGPALMVYGSNDGDDPSIVEGNYVEGSRTDSAILVGGGPAIVRNNVALGGNYASIGTQDYGGRGLQSGIRIVHNTVLPSDGAAIAVDNWTANSGNVIAHNAIFSGSKPALDPADPPGTVRDNVECSSASACFVRGDGAPYDLWPKQGGPLHDAVSDASADWVPDVDFMGIERSSPLDVGAFERVDRMFDREVGDGQPRPPRVDGDPMGDGDTGTGSDTGMSGGDTGTNDAGIPDTGATDTGTADTSTSSSDAGDSTDHTGSDAGADTGSPTDATDGVGGDGDEGGCNCSTGRSGPGAPFSLAVLIVGWMYLRRRR